MPAYVLAEIEITNPEGYKEYTKVVPGTIAQYGGKFLHRGGTVPQYEKPKAMRIAASKGRLLLLDGAS